MTSEIYKLFADNKPLPKGTRIATTQGGIPTGGTHELTDNQLTTRGIGFGYDALKSFIAQIGVVAIIILTAYFVLDGQMSIGMIMFHVLLFQNVASPIRQLHRIYDEVNDALTYAEGFFDILEDDSQIEVVGGVNPATVQGDIELQHVDFVYPNGNQALQDVSFRIRRNRITALVGLSGAGKSTIINLLVREQIDLLMNTDICKEYSFLEVYESIMFTFLRGISTEKGAHELGCSSGNTAKR